MGLFGLDREGPQTDDSDPSHYILHAAPFHNAVSLRASCQGGQEESRHQDNRALPDRRYLVLSVCNQRRVRIRVQMRQPVKADQAVPPRRRCELGER
jgi:hypothetical protein